MSTEEKPVKGIKSPVRLSYTVSAGRQLTRFLEGVAAGKLYGQRCDVCHKVYVPPRPGCPGRTRHGRSRS